MAKIKDFWKTPLRKLRGVFRFLCDLHYILEARNGEIYERKAEENHNADATRVQMAAILQRFCENKE